MIQMGQEKYENLRNLYEVLVAVPLVKKSRHRPSTSTGK